MMMEKQEGEEEQGRRNPRQESCWKKEMSAYIAFASGLHLFGNLEG